MILKLYYICMGLCVFAAFYQARKPTAKAVMKDDKQLNKALERYAKMCEKFIQDDQVYEERTVHEDFTDEKVKLKWGIESTKLKCQLEQITKYRQAIIDKYGYDPGDINEHKIIV